MTCERAVHVRRPQNASAWSACLQVVFCYTFGCQRTIPASKPDKVQSKLFSSYLPPLHPRNSPPSPRPPRAPLARGGSPPPPRHCPWRLATAGRGVCPLKPRTSSPPSPTLPSPARTISDCRPSSLKFGWEISSFRINDSLILDFCGFPKKSFAEELQSSVVLGIIPIKKIAVSRKNL